MCHLEILSQDSAKKTKDVKHLEHSFDKRIGKETSIRTGWRAQSADEGFLGVYDSMGGGGRKVGAWKDSGELSI